MTNRSDAWTYEHDRLLAETVLRHVRGRSTQLNAFEEAGDRLNRTGAACGYRWNSVLRKQYERELLEAKLDAREIQKGQTSLGIDRMLLRELMVYATAKGRPAAEVAAEAINDYLQGVGAR